jgi:hypothetical protein
VIGRMIETALPCVRRQFDIPELFKAHRLSVSKSIVRMNCFNRQRQLLNAML